MRRGGLGTGDACDGAQHAGGGSARTSAGTSANDPVIGDGTSGPSTNGTVIGDGTSAGTSAAPSTPGGGARTNAGTSANDLVIGDGTSGPVIGDGTSGPSTNGPVIGGGTSAGVSTSAQQHHFPNTIGRRVLPAPAERSNGGASANAPERRSNGGANPPEERGNGGDLSGVRRGQSAAREGDVPSTPRAERTTPTNEEASGPPTNEEVSPGRGPRRGTVAQEDAQPPSTTDEKKDNRQNKEQQNHQHNEQQNQSRAHNAGRSPAYYQAPPVWSSDRDRVSQSGHRTIERTVDSLREEFAKTPTNISRKRGGGSSAAGANKDYEPVDGGGKGNRVQAGTTSSKEVEAIFMSDSESDSEDRPPPASNTGVAVAPVVAKTTAKAVSKAAVKKAAAKAFASSTPPAARQHPGTSPALAGGAPPAKAGGVVAKEFKVAGKAVVAPGAKEQQALRVASQPKQGASAPASSVADPASVRAAPAGASHLPDGSRPAADPKRAQQPPVRGKSNARAAAPEPERPRPRARSAVRRGPKSKLIRVRLQRNPSADREEAEASTDDRADRFAISSSRGAPSSSAAVPYKRRDSGSAFGPEEAILRPESGTGANSSRAAGRSAGRGKSRARGLSPDEDWMEPALRKQVAEQRGGAAASSAADASVPPGSAGRSAARGKSRARTADPPLCEPPRDLSSARGAAASSRSAGRGKSRARGPSGDDDWVDPQLPTGAAPVASQQRGQEAALRKQVAEQRGGAAASSAAAGAPASSRAAGRSVGRPKSRVAGLPLLVGPPSVGASTTSSRAVGRSAGRGKSRARGGPSSSAAVPYKKRPAQASPDPPRRHLPASPEQQGRAAASGAAAGTTTASSVAGGVPASSAAAAGASAEQRPRKQSDRKKGMQTEDKSLPNQSRRPAPPKKTQFENDADDEGDELPPPKRARTAAPKNKGRKNGDDPYASSSPRSKPKGQVRSGNQI